MAAGAIFVAENGQEASTAIRAEMRALSTVTTGDLLFTGQVFRSRIRQRTFAGVDVNGQPFAPYGTKGPFYFYPNGSSASGRTAEGRKARATAAANRFAKTGKFGVRTPHGIKYASYSAAKAAHGVSNVNLYGMEQHTHMLDTMIVKAGGAELDMSSDILGIGTGELGAFESGSPAAGMQIGFYGPEAERAKGHNEGTSKLKKREFFALNDQDLQLGERAIAQRMMIRARSGHAGPGAAQPAGMSTITDDPNTWVPF